jgi:ADP-ribosyl-[dinitrogen reductase] hydrolase
MMGCIIGAFIGDACGTTIEFSDPLKINQKDLENCLNMNGGGPFNVGPGQLTDDSEMALQLARAFT